MEQFNITRRFGIFVHTDNIRCEAGKVTLFTERGLTVFTYNRESTGSDWALRRVWYFTLFAIHHISEGKTTATPGWHVTWASLKFKREYRGFTVRWMSADRYTIPIKRKKGRSNARTTPR